jgi:hypothetical protein
MLVKSKELLKPFPDEVLLAHNNSFNRSANSAALIENLRVSAVRRARLIRALDSYSFWWLE